MSHVRLCVVSSNLGSDSRQQRRLLPKDGDHLLCQGAVDQAYRDRYFADRHRRIPEHRQCLRKPVTTYKVGGFNTNDVAVSLIFVAVALSMVRTFNTEGFFPVGSEDDQLNRPFTFHLVTNYGKEITWAWFSNAVIPFIVITVSLSYFIIMPWNFSKCVSIVRQIEQENGKILGRRGINISPVNYDKWRQRNGGKESTHNEVRVQDIVEEGFSTELKPSVHVNLKYHAGPAKVHKTNKTLYTNYGWSCGYKHLDGSVPKRKKKKPVFSCLCFKGDG
eukprot:FR738353.1.p1 GENE.FR738353.1~~FR738353.1.p1  ORF type:complete len:276 (+),score=8.71 FR738353.1:82-909(+)